MWRTLAYRLRTLVRQPLFALVSIATLALGIGANTAMFSILHSVLLRPLPVQHSERLVMIWSESLKREQAVAEVSYDEQQGWKTQSTTFEDVAIFGSVLWNQRIVGVGDPIDVSYSSVSGNFFDTLGAAPLVGRTLRSDDDRWGGARRLVLSEGLWRRRFNGDPGVVGRTITLGDGPRAASAEIVGVMPAAFDFPRGAGMWVTTAPELGEIERNSERESSKFIRYLRVYYGIGRLRADAAGPTASADLERISRALFEARKVAPQRERVVLTPLVSYIFGSARPALYALMGAVGLVLLIACANVASLLLARGVAREREVAVRLALGANRRQIALWLLGDGVVIAIIGGALGVAIATASLQMLIALSPADIPRLADARIDGWVLLFAVAVSACTAVLVGLAPAWQLSKPDLVASLNRTTRAGGGGRSFTRQALVTGQVALTTILLIAAGLMIQSFMQLARLDLGFAPAQVLTFKIGGPEAKYPTIDAQHLLIETLRTGFQQLPGVVSADAIFQLPFAHGPIGMDTDFVLEGDTPKPGERLRPILNWEAVTPGYFRTMGIRLVRGRFFDQRDHEKAPLAVIVSETMAQRVWPGRDPIGQRMRAYGAFDNRNLWQTVVGVVATARYREIETPRLDLYLPMRQSPQPINTFVVRTTSDPARHTAAIRQAIVAQDPALTMDDVRTLTEIVERTQGPWRFNMLVFGVFAAVALMLAALGLFGLVAYTVTQRTREIGVRMALGATHAAVVGLMVRQGAQPVVVGLVVGVAVAALATRLVATLLFGVSATDPLAFAAGAAALLVVALAACYLPARRSARVDPLVALRTD
jgi:putative ABC transport system permease protein